MMLCCVKPKSTPPGSRSSWITSSQSERARSRILARAAKTDRRTAGNCEVCSGTVIHHTLLALSQLALPHPAHELQHRFRREEQYPADRDRDEPQDEKVRSLVRRVVQAGERTGQTGAERYREKEQCDHLGAKPARGKLGRHRKADRREQ